MLNVIKFFEILSTLVPQDFIFRKIEEYQNRIHQFDIPLPFARAPIKKSLRRI